jgi:iron complex outermembrane recepter protein
VEFSHDCNLGNGGKLIADGVFHYTTQQLLYPIAVPDAYSPGVGIGDINLTYKAPKDSWFVRAYVNNVADRAVILAVFPGYQPRDYLGPSPGSDYRDFGNIGAPRTFGVRIGTHF